MTWDEKSLSSRGIHWPVAAIWDLDGLLFDTMPLHLDCWRRVLEEEGFVYDVAIIREVSGCRNWEIGQALLKDQVKDLTRARLMELVARKQALFSERFARDVRLHAGVREWLDHFATVGYRQAVASSAAMQDIELAVSVTGIKGYFQTVLSTEVDVTRGKPAPDVFLLASERLGVDPACCIVLEDAQVGVRAAKAAGMYCVAVTNTQRAEELQAADLIVASLADASPAICDQWLSLDVT